MSTFLILCLGIWIGSVISGMCSLIPDHRFGESFVVGLFGGSLIALVTCIVLLLGWAILLGLGVIF